jgi:hypothetical protein
VAVQRRRNAVASRNDHDNGSHMSNVDTLKTGGAQIVSFAVARFESRRLLPEQLSDLLTETTEKNADVEVHIEDYGLAPPTK